MTWLDHGYELIDGVRPPSDPWSYIAELVGQRPEMVEVQPIRPVEHGRSFASTRGFTPLHTDSQDYRGVAPKLQVMICRQAAARGGETILLDTRPRAHLGGRALRVAYTGAVRGARRAASIVVTSRAGDAPHATYDHRADTPHAL